MHRKDSISNNQLITADEIYYVEAIPKCYTKYWYFT